MSNERVRVPGYCRVSPDSHPVARLLPSLIISFADYMKISRTHARLVIVWLYLSYRGILLDLYLELVRGNFFPFVPSANGSFSTLFWHMISGSFLPPHAPPPAPPPTHLKWPGSNLGEAVLGISTQELQLHWCDNMLKRDRGWVFETANVMDYGRRS